MEKCTKFMSWAVLILFLTLMVAVLPTDKEGAIYDDTLRLHILANSDSEEDQQLKLQIRDKLLEKYGTALSDAESKEDASELISSLKDEVKADVDGWMRDAGYDYESEIEIGTEWYDTREYEDFTLPSGYYTSVRVKLGKADGRNWWCVMYPPLCLDIATESAPADDAIHNYTKEETVLISGGKYSVKFKLLEFASETFRDIMKKS